MRFAIVVVLATLLLVFAGAPGWAGSYGPNSCFSSADSPFSGVGFSSFWREDFEDHLPNVPGGTTDHGGVTSVVFGPSIHDSVDADDGTIDGLGLKGDSYFYAAGAGGVTFTFNASVLGALPADAGIVWTDGAGGISFEAFGPGGSLGTLSGNHADGTNAGTTGEDRFHGWPASPCSASWEPAGSCAAAAPERGGSADQRPGIRPSSRSVRLVAS